jgi:hypothetical protein
MNFLDPLLSIAHAEEVSSIELETRGEAVCYAFGEERYDSTYLKSIDL